MRGVSGAARKNATARVRSGATYYIEGVKRQTAKPQPPEPLPAFSEDGIDLTLIRWMLSLTPDERLRHLEEHAAFVQELRDANPSLQLSRHP
jgi:hypothetical protein